MELTSKFYWNRRQMAECTKKFNKLQEHYTLTQKHVIITRAVVPKMTYYVSGGMLNLLAHSCIYYKDLP